MKRVTEVGNESHRVLSSLCDRTRREKVEKTSEFTEWLNQEETRLEEMSKAYADPAQFSMSLDQKSHVLMAHKKAIEDCRGDILLMQLWGESRGDVHGGTYAFQSSMVQLHMRAFIIQTV